MSNGTIVLVGLIAAVCLLSGVGVSAYKRIKNASRPGGGVADTLERLKEELEARDGDAAREKGNEPPK